MLGLSMRYAAHQKRLPFTLALVPPIAIFRRVALTLQGGLAGKSHCHVEFKSMDIKTCRLQEFFVHIWRTAPQRSVAKLVRSSMATGEKQVMVVGIDESEHSLYALEWTLDHLNTLLTPANSPFKLIVVHAKPSPSSAVGLAAPGAAEVLPFVDSDLKKIAARVIEKAKAICVARSVMNVVSEVIEGDARNVLCQAVEKHHASVLVIGSHGYGAIKRAVLGSVSDYCAHHAHCTVMIVKKPKTKH